MGKAEVVVLVKTRGSWIAFIDQSKRFSGKSLPVSPSSLWQKNKGVMNYGFIILERVRGGGGVEDRETSM